MSVVNTLHTAVACLRQRGPSPNAANDVLAAIDKVKPLIDACSAYVGPLDDPNIGWKGTSPSNPDLFKCECCGQEHLDCFLIPHATDCPAVRLVAALAQVQQ